MTKKGLFIAAGIVAIIAIVAIFHAHHGAWGRPETITVVGTAHKDEVNQVAQFYAGVTAVNADKQAAIAEVNKKMDEVMAKVKEFGIVPADIKTQSVTVYQDQEQVTEGGRQTYQPGKWRANNSIQIKLRDASKTSDLVSLLAASGLTDISGPNFMLDDDASENNQAELLKQAVEKARAKADVLAQANGKKVKRILSITEGGSQSNPVMFEKAMSGMGGGGAPVEPGTSSIQATATVVFEVR